MLEFIERGLVAMTWCYKGVKTHAGKATRVIKTNKTPHHHYKMKPDP